MKNTKLENIDRVWKLIENSSRWTQEVFAKDTNGIPCGALHPSAVCFCAVGALMKIYFERPNDIYGEKLTILQNSVGSLACIWNDRSTHAQVLNKFRELDI